MALFITGDLHGRSYLSKLDKFNTEFGKELSKKDVLIILGDFSIPWSDTPSTEDILLIEHINNYPWTTAFIDGNHENHNALEKMPLKRKFNNSVHIISENIFHLRRGYNYKIANHSILAMGGAISLDTNALQKAHNWWPQEVPNNKEKNRCIKTIAKQKQFDIILTHAAPTHQLIQHAQDTQTPWYPDEWDDWLEENIAKKATFNTWFYGHMHDDRPWETHFIPLMHVIYDIDSRFPDRLWGPNSLLDDWYPGEPF